MLSERGVEVQYREYTEDPLSHDELVTLFQKLSVAPQSLLRKNDRAYKENGLTGEESTERVLELMALHPTLLQRPIGVLGGQALVGRPAERLLELLD